MVVHYDHRPFLISFTQTSISRSRFMAVDFFAKSDCQVMGMRFTAL